MVFAIMMFFTPASGVPNEEMLQDTLKSILVSFAALIAALVFFWEQRNRATPLRWHGVMWLPLLLMAWALGSMAWSHTFLAGVETIRWFIFSLIVWLGLNSLSRERLPLLAAGIHWGAVVASFWTASQFWVNLNVFPQGPNPASTFVNRNFFAEFVVCTLPFSVLCLAKARASSKIFLLALSTGFNIVAIMMTGTRSALAAVLILLPLFAVIAYLYRDQFEFSRWDRAQKALALGVLLATVLGLGMTQTGNPQMLEDNALNGRGLTPIARSFSRVSSMAEKEEYTERSFSIRLIMWKATARMIAARPFSGVGAGAWEVDVPLYQGEGAQLETDYYVHNEILQLLAEYGLTGWLFLLCLLAYLSRAAWTTWRDPTPEGQAEAPYRALTLASLLALLVVSNAGFPWRMASTGAIFALCLAVLAASDARLGRRGLTYASSVRWHPLVSRTLLQVTLACLMLAAYITQQAAQAESKIVRAVKMALTISQYGDVKNPRWTPMKAEMLQLLREGVAINPHYRKITPMAADELARWGDWNDALWIWESVDASRPYVVALIGNIARGYIQIGQNDKALQYIQRAMQIQPDAPAVRALQIYYLMATNRNEDAYRSVQSFLATGAHDDDLLQAAYTLAVRVKDWKLALHTMELRVKYWPDAASNAWLKIGNIYVGTELRDEQKALDAFRAAVAAAPVPQKDAVKAQVPRDYAAKL
jgi:O-antigen ligase